MKNSIMIGAVSATLFLVGCSKEAASSSTPAAGGDAVAVTDGSNTFFVGGIRIDGTNVSGTNVTVGVRPRETAK